MTKTDLILIVALVIFTSTGIWGSFSVKFIEDYEALGMTTKWFLMPALLIGGYYAYYSMIKHGPKQAQWKKVLGLFALTMFFTLMILRSIQGYLILWNCNFGKQSKVSINGVVTKLDYPRKKKLLNRYSIVVHLNNKSENIELVVPTNIYNVGQSFQKEMIKGSLGLIYSP
jgi:hypothetical protein